MKQELPVWLRALLDALRLQVPDPSGLLRLDEKQWQRLLAFCDETHLTLALGGDLPPAVQERVSGDRLRNAERWRRTRIAYEEIAAAFVQRQLGHVVLKGFSHCPEFVQRPEERVQYDIDLWLTHEDLAAGA